MVHQTYFIEIFSLFHKTIRDAGEDYQVRYFFFASVADGFSACCSTR